MSFVSDEGRPAIFLQEGGTSTSLYMDPLDTYAPPEGTVIHFSAEVKVTEDTSAITRLRLPSYRNSEIDNSIGEPNDIQTVEQGWVRHEVHGTVAAMPGSAYTRALVYPATGSTAHFSLGEGYLVRNYLIEYDTTGDFFDGDSPDHNGKKYRWDKDGVAEEYVPASSFKATERYKHDGSKWVNVGLEMVSPFLPVVLAGSTIQGVHTVEIGGDAPVYPTYVVDGPGSDLIIENDRGQSIKVLTSFEEQVTITTHPLRRDIVSPSNPDGELWEYVPTTSEFFALEPGSQKIKFSMVGSKPTSRVRIIYRENYWAGW